MPKASINRLIDKYTLSTFDGIGRFDPRVLEQEGLNHQQAYKDWNQDCLNKLQQLDSFIGDEYKIPLFEHTIFLTSNTTPKQLREEYTEKMIASSKRLIAEDPNFQPILWTNNLEIADLKTIKTIKKEVPTLQVRSVSEFEDHLLYEHLTELLKKGQEDYRFFVEASDVARIMIEQKYGGIYHDLDYEIFDAEAMTRYMKSFDYFNGREEHNRWDSFTGNAFIAVKPNHPVMNKAASLTKRNLDKGPDAPEYIHYPLNKFDSVICSTGPAMLNVAYHLVGNTNGNIDMIFPGNVLYNADFARQKSKNLKNLPTTDWKWMQVKTIGGDLFQGKWGDDYLNNIQYRRTHNEKVLKVLNDLNQNDFSSYKEYIKEESDQQTLDDMILLGLSLHNEEINECLTEKLTDQTYLYKLFEKAVFTEENKIVEILLKLAINTGQSELVEDLALKVKDQYFLYEAFKFAIQNNQAEIAKNLALEIKD